MNQTWTDVYNDIHIAEQPEKVLAILSKAQEYDEDTRWRVISSGLDRLWDMEYDDFENVLLKQCIERSERETFSIHATLKRWLKENPTRRNEVICRLLPELDSNEANRVQNVLWTLITVGYRDEILERKLVDLVNARLDEKTGHVALWALTHLGYPDYAFIEQAILKFIEQHEEMPDLILHCANRLASLELLPHFQNYIVSTKFSSNNEAYLVNLLYVLARTAQAHSEVAPIVWDTILRCRDVSPDHSNVLYDVLSFYSDISGNIDDQRVADFFLGGLQPDYPEMLRKEERMSRHYRPYLRLRDLCLPNQLAAMHSSLERVGDATHLKLLEILHKDATVNTRNRGVSQTQLSTLKEHCWEIVLRLSLPEAEQWIVEALNETGSFVAADICRLAGFLRVNQAVPKLQQWIKRDDWDKEEGFRLALGLAALKALGNIGTPEAFHALTESQVSFAGRNSEASVPSTTPQDHGEAFTSCVLTMQNAEPLIACLEREISASPRCWIACAFALQQVAINQPSLVAPYRDRVFALLRRNDVFQEVTLYLHYLIPALGGFDKDEQVSELLLNWARSKSDFVVVAMEVLARWEILQHDSSLLEKLGLTSIDGTKWNVARHMDTREAFIVGLLFRNNPSMFTPAVCDLIEKGTYQETTNVLQQINPEVASKPLIDSLAKRALDSDLAFGRDRMAQWTLRRVDASRFADLFTYENVEDWPASERQSIVVAYEDLKGNEVCNSLVGFLRDPVAIIRRIAARQFAKADSMRLTGEIQSLLNSDDAYLRQYGIEATTWLNDERVFHSLLQQARRDREANVRNSADYVMKERRNVLLAQDYTQKVLNTPSDQLITTWCYGQALEQVGDNETIQRLAQANNEGGTPNRRAYLQYLQEQVEKSWKKRQDKTNDFFAD